MTKLSQNPCRDSQPDRIGLRSPGGRAAVAIFASALLLSGCSSVNRLLEGDKLDYKSETKPAINALEIPPGLSTLPRDDRFNIPDRTGNGTTLSGYNLQRASGVAAVSPMLPSVPDASLERAGSQRWLVVNKKPEEIWPVVKDFWQDMGFLVKIESQETGVMETDWAENRAKIPQDFIRSTIGKLIDGLYSTGERDKFRTRLERTTNGTEIYVSHRGMVEVYANTRQETTTWQPRPSDPELEAEFLRRLLVRFGVEVEKAKSVVTNTPVIQRAKLVRNGNDAYVQVDEGFDRAWRRVGLALDRVGFTVEDRDRTQGVYYVRYVDPDADNRSKTPTGFFGRLFSFGSSSDPKQAQQYRVVVRGQGNNLAQVLVQNRDGSPETGDVGNRILALMQEQLK